MVLRQNERYVLLMALAFFATTVLFSFNDEGLEVYLSAYIIEYFIITNLSSPMKPKTARILDVIGYLLLLIFAVIVVERVWAILYGVNLL